MDKALIIFIKNPVLGKVKTRLAAEVGDDKALQVYQHLLLHTRQITIPVQANRLLFYQDKVTLQDNWDREYFQKHLQHGDDLGEKMLHAFQTAFSLGHTKVLIIGSDCIELDRKILENAFEELDAHEFVIGPARDGGYYLLGMRSAYAGLFINKTWSHPHVFPDTMKVIRSLNKPCSILTELSDIDTLADLNPELLDLIK